MTAKQKGTVRLMDGRIVPDFVKQYHLPIITHRPHKWAMVDMEDGNIWVVNPFEAPDSRPISATNADKKLIGKISRKRR